jgi:hypothetical protein
MQSWREERARPWRERMLEVVVESKVLQNSVILGPGSQVLGVEVPSSTRPFPISGCHISYQGYSRVLKVLSDKRKYVKNLD